MAVKEPVQETVQEKFARLRGQFAGKQDMLAIGFSEAEIDALREGHRTREAGTTDQGNFLWPEIGGKKVYPLSFLLTRQEKDAYNVWYRSTHCSSTNSAFKGRLSDSEKESLKGLLGKLPEDLKEEGQNLWALLCPEEKRKEDAVKSVLAQLTDEQLTALGLKKL
jgi:hypothetical protein